MLRGLVATFVAGLVLATAAQATPPGARGPVFVNINAEPGQAEPGDLADGVYRIDPSGGVQLVYAGGTDFFDVSPDGATLVYIVAHPSPLINGGEVRLRDVATGVERKLVDTGFSALFSPDGTRVLVMKGLSNTSGEFHAVAGGAGDPFTIDTPPTHRQAIRLKAWDDTGLLADLTSDTDLERVITARISATTGAVTPLQPLFSRPAPEGDAGYVVEHQQELLDIRPDDGELIGTDQEGARLVCQDSCSPAPPCPSGQVQAPGATSCLKVLSYARLTPTGGLSLRPTEWLRVDNAQVPSGALRWLAGFRPAAYTPDEHVIGWRATGFHGLADVPDIDWWMTGPRLMVEDEPATLLDPGLPIDFRRTRVVALADGALVDVNAPPGEVTGSSASVGFAPPAGAGHVECALDGAAFATCTTPVALSSLAEGDHVLRLRFVPDGGQAGGVREVRWHVDLTAPSVSITGAPSGVVEADSGSVSFSATGTDVDGFRCQLDDGPSEVCLSPYAFAGLEPGVHSVTVVARDVVGNASAPARATWEVRAPAGAAAAPPSDTPGRCAGGLLQKFVAGPVVAVTDDGCFTVIRQGATERITHAGEVRVNGIVLTPLNGATHVIVERSAASARVAWDGPVRVTVGPFSFVLSRAFSWDGISTGAVGLVNRMFAAADLALQRDQISRFIPKVPSIELSSAKGGSAKLTFGVAFPDIFTTVPGTKNAPKFNVASGQWEGGGAVFEVAPRVSNDEGFVLAAKAQVKELWLFGNVKLRDVSLGFDTGEQTLSLSALLALNEVADVPGFGIDKGAEVAVSLSLGPNGVLGTPLRELKILTGKLEKHLGEGFYLQRLGGGIGSRGANLMTLGAQVGVSWGPRLTFGSFTGELLSLDGTGTLLIPTTPGGAGGGFEAGGELTALGVFKGNDAKLTVVAPTTSLTGRFDLPALGIYRFAGQLTRGDFDAGGASFTLQGNGDLTVPVFGSLAGVSGLITDHGWALCTTLLGRRVGLAAGRGTRLQDVTPLVDSCDLERLAGSAARSAQTGASSVQVPAGARVLALVAQGAATVRLSGPRGRVIDVRPPVRSRDVVAWADGEDVVALLRSPAAGRWSVTGLDGSVVSGVVASRDVVATVDGSVRTAGSGRLGLRWRATLPSRARISFAETAAGAQAPILTTAATSGQTSFTPRPGLGRRRTLVAIVSRDGAPVRRLVVARYTATEALLRAPRRLTLRRRTLRWKRVVGARRYRVTVEPAASAVVVRTVRRTQTTLAAKVAPGTTIRVAAVTAAGRFGPAASITAR